MPNHFLVKDLFLMSYGRQSQGSFREPLSLPNIQFSAFLRRQMGQVVLLEQEVSTELVPQNRELCSCGLSVGDTLLLHAHRTPGGHPGMHAKCGQAANLGVLLRAFVCTGHFR